MNYKLIWILQLEEINNFVFNLNSFLWIHGAAFFFEKLVVTQLIRKFCTFLESGGSLSGSQKSEIRPITS
jgi:hypothetical protein